MTFNPTTSYSQDYQWMDFVENVSWHYTRVGEGTDDIVNESLDGLKGRWGDFDTPDLTALAAGLGLSSQAAAIVVWEPIPSDADDDWEPTFSPKPGHTLRRQDVLDEAGSPEGWIIQSVHRSRFGHWLLPSEKEVLNA